MTNPPTGAAVPQDYSLSAWAERRPQPGARTMTREGMLNAAFDQVMSAPGMPNESDPDYERWLFDAFVAAIEAAGVRLVPVEASRHMLVATHMVESDDIELTEDEHRAMYAAVVAASPYAPPGG